MDLSYPHISHWENHPQMGMVIAHQHQLSKGLVVMIEDYGTTCIRLGYGCHCSFPTSAMPLGDMSMMGFPCDYIWPMVY